MNTSSNKWKGLRTWIRQVATWTGRGLKTVFPYASLVIVICGIMYFDSSLTTSKEQDIRWFGLLFQIIGFAIVLRQLNARLRLFRRPSFLSRIKKYFASFPSPYGKAISVSASSVMVEFGVSSAELSLGLSPDITLEQRVDILAREIENLTQRLRKTESSLGNHKVESKRSFDEVHENISSKHNELRKLVDEAIIAGINLEWVGIVYFIVGICLATTSSDISAYLG